MAKGLTNKEIGGVLHISPGTAKNHVAAVITALEVTNRTEAATALHELGLGTGAEADSVHTVTGFGGRPAIAVLPFDNFSDDPEQSFLADGIVEDLVTRLATWRWFPVISRNSTFAYKGRTIDVKEVSRALGARYVVEGSVRRAGDRVRITAQLIDGASDRHAWADRYDCEIADVFDTIDEVVDKIVMTLEPAIAKIEGVRVLTQHPAELKVWECLQRGFVHLARLDSEGLRDATQLFERAIELDPDSSEAYAGLAFTQVTELGYQLSEDREAAITRVVELSRRAIACDPNDPLAHFTLGIGLSLSGDSEGARTENARALELNPSIAWAHCGLGITLCALSRVDEAIAPLETAIRLSPQDPFLPYMLVALGSAQGLRGHLDEAIASLKQSLQIAPHLPIAYGVLAICQAGSGRMDDARNTLSELAEKHPGFSPLEGLRGWVPPENFSALEGVLAAAGWVEPE